MFAVCKLHLVDCWLVCKYWKCVFQSSVYYQFLYLIILQMSIVNSTPFIFNTDSLMSFSRLMIIDWNLSGFTIMLFGLNQFIAVSHSFCKSSKSSVKSLHPTYIVLSSSKFASLASLMKKNKSFIKRLKRSGPRIDPSGTPDKRIWKNLSVSLIFKHYLLHFKCE